MTRPLHARLSRIPYIPANHQTVRVLPDWISWRHSLANVDRRLARGETVVECDECLCEIDVERVAHSPRCGQAVEA